MMSKPEELFKQFSKSRLFLVEPSKSDRKGVRNALREVGLGDIMEFDDYEEAWQKLQLTYTNLLIFSTKTKEGITFLKKLIDSSRFRKSPMLIFSDKIKQDAGRFENSNVSAKWLEMPMNGLKVENALVNIFEVGVVEKSQIGGEHAGLEHYTIGTKAFEDGDYETAKERLRHTLKEDSEFFEGYIKMVETLMRLKDYGAAERVLGRAISLRPDDPRSLRLKAELASIRGEKDKAITVFDEVVKKRSSDLHLVIDIGNMALEHGWIDEAIRYFELAKNCDPDLLYVYNRLGIAHSRAKRYDEALDMYEKALAIDDQDAGVLFNIGMTHSRKGNKQKAIEFFKKAEEIDPEMEEPKKMIEKLEAEL